jgi:hypothetical protein
MITTNSRVTLKDPFMANLHGEMWVYEILPNQGKKHYTLARCVHAGEEYQEGEEARDELGVLLYIEMDNALPFDVNELEEVGPISKMSLSDLM